MFSTILGLAFWVGVAYVLGRFTDSLGPPIYQWDLTERVQYPAAIVRAAIKEVLGSGEHVDRPPVTVDLYRRGDERIEKVSDAREVSLRKLPSVFAIAVGQEDKEVSLVIQRTTILRQVRMDPSVAKDYEILATIEFYAVLKRLKEVAERLVRERETDRQRRPSEQRAIVFPAGHADFAVLGLKVGATMDQVQAAYRDACRKYHPDRFAGRGLEPHLVELAALRFKEITAAYQRLKEQLARPAHT